MPPMPERSGLPGAVPLAVALAAAGLALGAAGRTAPAPHPAAEDATRMNGIAESYVKLVLAVGQHDSNYVDAYYGPAEWKTEASASKVPLAEIDAGAARLIGEIGS